MALLLLLPAVRLEGRLGKRRATSSEIIGFTLRHFVVMGSPTHFQESVLSNSSFKDAVHKTIQWLFNLVT